MNSILAVCLTLFFGNVLTINLVSPILRSHPPPPTGPPRDSDEVTLEYFIQKLDHFDDGDTSIWVQRYYLNKQHFNTTNNNVAFLHLGGEAAIEGNWSLYGTWVDMGKKYGALMFQLEHRFYGESQPFDDSSTEHLRYHSSEQALADAANFISSMNEAFSLPSDVKWIVFGGSYSGALAAWMRLKYPDLVLAAVASSAPVQAKLNFFEYFTVTINDLATVSDACVDNLKTAMTQVEDILKDPNSDQSVTAILNVCVPVEGLDSDDLDLQSFHNRVGRVFSSTAQVNGLAPPSVDDLCEILLDEEKGEEIYRLSDAIRLQHGSGCLANNYTRNVESMQYIEAFYGVREWVYQTCTEFGWFQTTDWLGVFGSGVPLDFFTNMCADIFGPSFNKTFITNQIELTNSKYGGIHLNVSNVVFVHGSVDPWNPMGVREPVNPESFSIFIEGTAHCADMYTNYPDLPQIAAAKEKIDGLVGGWLGV